MTVTRDGYETAETSTSVAAGEKRPLEIPLAKLEPITKKWWFWTGIGAVVVTGVVIGIAEATTRSADFGSIDPGQVKAGGFRF